MRLPRKSGITSPRSNSLGCVWEIESGQKLLDVIDEISRDLVPHVEAAE